MCHLWWPSVCASSRRNGGARFSEIDTADVALLPHVVMQYHGESRAIQSHPYTALFRFWSNGRVDNPVLKHRHCIMRPNSKSLDLGHFQASHLCRVCGSCLAQTPLIFCQRHGASLKVHRRRTVRVKREDAPQSDPGLYPKGAALFGSQLKYGTIRVFGFPPRFAILLHGPKR